MGKKDKPDFPKAKKKLGKPAKGVTATNLQFQTKGFVRLHFIYPSVSAFFVAVAAFRIDGKQYSTAILTPHWFAE
jgi:hypothetical protein